MLFAISLGISIGRDWRELYEEIWHPEAFPKWALGLAQSELRKEGGH